MLDEPLYIRAGGSLVAEALIHLRACESLHGGLRLDSDDEIQIGQGFFHRRLLIHRAAQKIA